jgi:hypothetical protein
VLAEAGQLNRPPGEFDTPQVLALSRVSQLAASAHRRVAGRLRSVSDGLCTGGA